MRCHPQRSQELQLSCARSIVTALHRRSRRLREDQKKSTRCRAALLRLTTRIYVEPHAKGIPSGRAGSAAWHQRLIILPNGLAWLGWPLGLLETALDH
jgi:hypothetical protein